MEKKFMSSSFGGILFSITYSNNKKTRVE